MNEQSYLQRLASIRDKYGCTNTHEYYSKPIDKLYTKNNVSLNEYTKTNVNQSKLNPPSSTYQKEIPNYSTYKEDARHERAYSMLDKARLMEQTKLKYQDNSTYQLSQAQIKRQENFSNFIKDLDSRIQEKQKLLSHRYKENQKLIKRANGYNQLNQPHYLQKYESQKNFRSIPKHFDKAQPQFIRKSYEKNFVFKNRCDTQTQNIQNQIPTKLQSSPIKSKLKQYATIVRQSPQTLHPSPARFIEKKLQNNLALGKDGWNPHKLEGIQQRIKSVLKQCNN